MRRPNGPLLRLVLPLLLLATVAPGSATPVLNPQNGHYYDTVQAIVTWSAAKTAAEAMTYLGLPGHLATVSDSLENQFIWDHFGGTNDRYWLGGYQDHGAPGYSEPAGGWQWVTGEPFSFTRWQPGEPNNSGAGEDYVRFERWVGNPTCWNDAPDSYVTSTGYIVEYEGIVFTDISAGLPGVRVGSVAWGDYDNDGDLDLVLMGDTGAGRITRVYRNDGGAFTDVHAGLPGLSAGCVAWGDYDNDGDLDLVLTGVTGPPLWQSISRVYRNDAGSFTDVGAGLPGLEYSSAAWGDYDNDGDLDLVLTGDHTSRVYRNDGGGSFTDIGAGLLGVYVGSAAWGDYDNDGDLDLVLNGTKTEPSRAPSPISLVYRNDAGSFTDIGAGLPGVWSSSDAWGDYDNDGDLDLVLTGIYGGYRLTRVYRNDGGGSFTDIGAGLPPAGATGSIAWGDYDNDGDLDLALTDGFTTRVYRNNGGGSFTDIGAELPGLVESVLAWGDYDNDGDLDLALAGKYGSSYITRVYRNNGAPPNTPPVAPTCGPVSVIDSRAQLKWSAGSDGQTPTPSLSYNLRVGTTPGGGDVLSPMAGAGDGYRRTVAMGNTNHMRWYSLQLPPGDYYWSVQAVDGGFAGSPFAPEASFSVSRARPDLRIDVADLSAVRIGADSLALTAVVRNIGYAAAESSGVRFFDARQDTALGPDVAVRPLAPGEADTCRVTWSAVCSHDRFRAQVDPDARIEEIYDRNNAAELSFGDSLGIAECFRARITAVSAKYGRLKTANHFGRYLKGVKGSREEFTVSLSDPDSLVTRLAFVIGHCDTAWVARADGWKYSAFDPGTLMGNDTLRVRAFAGLRPASEEYVGILETRSMPEWLKQWFDLGVGPIKLESESGLNYLTFKVAVAAERDSANADSLAAAHSSLIDFEDLIDAKIPIVGGKGSKFKLDIDLKLWVPLLDGQSWKAEGSIKREAEILGKESTQEVGVTVWLSESGVDSLKLDPPLSVKFKLWELPEKKSPPYVLGGLEVVFSVGMEVFLNLQLEAEARANFDSLLVTFAPGVGADFSLKGAVSLPALKFAKVEVIAEPSLELGPLLRYERGPASSDTLKVAGFFKFSFKGQVVASITFKVWKYTSTKTWTVVTFPTYEKRWTYPKVEGQPAMAEMFLAAAEEDSSALYVPDIFPYPNAASHPSGKVGFVWIGDADPDSDAVASQVYYAWKAPTDTSWSSEPVTTDAVFKSYATLAYLPDGRPIAVWVQGSYTEEEANPDWTLSEVLERQDLWFAVRDSNDGTWNPAAVRTDPVDSLRADGMPAIARTENGAALAWTRRAAAADSALALGSSEIYLSSYDAGTWSAPYALTDDGLDDTSPALCAAGGDSAVVLWVRQDAVAGAPNELVWSNGEGSNWRSPQVLSGGVQDWTKQPPSIARAEDGRALATWVETEVLAAPADSAPRPVLYHLRAATLAAGDTAWTAIDEVLTDSVFVENPIALVDRRNIGTIVWRGYNGVDGDLWYSLRDLDQAGSSWTLPRCIAADTLTDWMATATLDPDNNLYVVDQQSDLSQPPAPPSQPALFPGGLRLQTRGISNTLELSERMNVNFRPLSCDLTLGTDSVWVASALPTVGETDSVTAYVRNIGDYVSTPGVVRFYHGHPDSVGSVALVPDAVLPAIAPDDSVLVSAPWVVAAGAHELYAVVDPDAAIGEQDDGNNRAYVAVTVVPDLAVDSVVVSNANPVPGGTDTLRAFVRNVGGAVAADYAVRFGKLGGTLGTLSGLSLAPDDSAILELPFTAAAGVDTLFALADPDSLLPDPDRTNDRAWQPLRVLADLAVSVDLREGVPDDVRFREGFAESLSVSIANVGGVALAAGDTVKVRLLSGNPRAGGLPLTSDIIWPLGSPPDLPAGAADTMFVAWADLDPVLRSLGVPIGRDGLPLDPIAIFAVVDPTDAIEERSELDNEDFLSIGDGLPQLTVVTGSLAVASVAGGVDTVSALVSNLGTVACQGVVVEFFQGDPDTGGVLIDDRLIPRLVPGETARSSVTWNAPAANVTIYAVVDRPGRIAEYNESDNRISQPFDLTVSVPDVPVIPARLALYPARPNPFTGQTAIRFDLPRKGRVQLQIFDVAGRVVRRLIDQDMPAGVHSTRWDGWGDRHLLSAGVYFMRLRVEGEVLTRKVVKLN